MGTHESRRRTYAVLDLPAVVVVMALAAVNAPAATFTADAHMTDFFHTTPDRHDTPPALTDDTHVPPGHPVPSLTAAVSDRETGAGGSAFAKGGVVLTQESTDDFVVLGVQAAARSVGNRVGRAHASATVNYAVTVDFEIPNGDPLLTVLANACDRGCALATDFLHETTGHFSFSSFIDPGSSARFSEELNMQGASVASGEAFVAGTQPVGGPSVVTPGVNGVWRPDDFVSSSTTANGTELVFNHFEQIVDQPAVFVFFTRHHQLPDLDTNFLQGVYDLTLTQHADADFGTSLYTFGALEADFAHTSTFSLARVYDPLGRFDLSAATVSVHFTDRDAVPVPPSLAMLSSAIALVGYRWRRERKLR